MRLLHQRDFARPPGLVERTVETQSHEPALAGVGLDPVAFLDAFRQIGSYGGLIETPNIDALVAGELKGCNRTTKTKNPRSRLMH